MSRAGGRGRRPAHPPGQSPKRTIPREANPQGEALGRHNPACPTAAGHTPEGCAPHLEVPLAGGLAPLLRAPRCPRPPRPPWSGCRGAPPRFPTAASQRTSACLGEELVPAQASGPRGRPPRWGPRGRAAPLASSLRPCFCRPDLAFHSVRAAGWGPRPHAPTPALPRDPRCGEKAPLRVPREGPAPQAGCTAATPRPLPTTQVGPRARQGDRQGDRCPLPAVRPSSQSLCVAASPDPSRPPGVWEPVLWTEEVGGQEATDPSDRAHRPSRAGLPPPTPSPGERI